MMEDLDVDRIKTQFLIAKIRWGRMDKDPWEIVRHKKLDEIEEEEKIEIISNRERREVDIDKKNGLCWIQEMYINESEQKNNLSCW